MAKTKQQKQEAIKELSEKIKTAPTSVFLGFTAIPVDVERGLRRELRKDGVEYKVTKKTLFGKALESAGYKMGDGFGTFEGMQMALAYLDKTDADSIAPAKGIAVFIKGHKEQMKILGGVFEGKIMSQLEMVELSTIPSLQVLRGMFVNVINSPIQGLVLALNAIAGKKEA